MDGLVNVGRRERGREKERKKFDSGLFSGTCKREREDMPVCPYCAGRQIDDSDEFR